MIQENSEKNNKEQNNNDTPQEDAGNIMNERTKEGVAIKDDASENHDDSDIHAPGEGYADTSDSSHLPLAERFGSIDILGRKIGFGYIAFAILVIIILGFGLKSRFGGESLESYQSQQIAPQPDQAPIQNQLDTNTSPSTESQVQASQTLPATSSDVQQQLAVTPQAPTITEERIKELVKDFILNNPEVIMDSLTNLEKKEIAKEQQQQPKEDLHKTSIAMPTGKPFIGNPNGTLNIIEFFDYRCIHCSKVYPTLAKLLSDYPNLKISLVPLPFMGQDSAMAAKYSLAISSLYPEKFHDFHADLLSAQSLDDQAFTKLLDKYGFDKDKVMQAVHSTQIENFLKENLQEAQKLEVRGVPSFVINGESLPGAASYEEFKKKLDAIKPSNTGATKPQEEVKTTNE